MDNLFSTNKEIHIRYDLKGSIIGRRELSENENRDFKFDHAAYALKDLDLEDQKKFLTIGEKKDKFMQQMKNDTEFLKKNNIIDYSLLVGIHMRDLDKNYLKSDIPFNTANNNVNNNVEFKVGKGDMDGSIEKFSENSMLNYDLNYTESVKNKSIDKEKLHPFKDVFIIYFSSSLMEVSSHQIKGKYITLE